MLFKQFSVLSLFLAGYLLIRPSNSLDIYKPSAKASPSLFKVIRMHSKFSCEYLRHHVSIKQQNQKKTSELKVIFMQIKEHVGMQPFYYSVNVQDKKYGITPITLEGLNAHLQKESERIIENSENVREREAKIAPENTYPFNTVGVFQNEYGAGSAQYVLNNDTLITAAHCVESPSKFSAELIGFAERYQETAKVDKELVWNCPRFIAYPTLYIEKAREYRAEQRYYATTKATNEEWEEYIKNEAIKYISYAPFDFAFAKMVYPNSRNTFMKLAKKFEKQDNMRIAGYPGRGPVEHPGYNEPCCDTLECKNQRDQKKKHIKMYTAKGAAFIHKDVAVMANTFPEGSSGGAWFKINPRDKSAVLYSVQSSHFAITTLPKPLVKGLSLSHLIINRKCSDNIWQAVLGGKVSREQTVDLTAGPAYIPEFVPRILEQLNKDGTLSYDRWDFKFAKRITSTNLSDWEQQNKIRTECNNQIKELGMSTEYKQMAINVPYRPKQFEKFNKGVEHKYDTGMFGGLLIISTVDRIYKEKTILCSAQYISSSIVMAAAQCFLSKETYIFEKAIFLHGFTRMQYRSSNCGKYIHYHRDWTGNKDMFNPLPGTEKASTAPLNFVFIKMVHSSEEKNLLSLKLPPRNRFEAEVRLLSKEKNELKQVDATVDPRKQSREYVITGGLNGVGKEKGIFHDGSAITSPIGTGAIFKQTPVAYGLVSRSYESFVTQTEIDEVKKLETVGE